MGWGLQDTSESTIELQTNPREDSEIAVKTLLKDTMINRRLSLNTVRRFEIGTPMLWGWAALRIYAKQPARSI